MMPQQQAIHQRAIGKNHENKTDSRYKAPHSHQADNKLIRTHLVIDEEQNRKECFMARLRFTINAAEISTSQISSLSTFKGILKSEWNMVRQIVYYSKEELVCPICLQREFLAPQMTSCGHLFCWPCLLMYYEKSRKACFCPVCNQVFEIQHIVTCHPRYCLSYRQTDKNQVAFALKGRKEGDSRVYDPTTLAEDINFSRVVRATPQKILSIFEKQLNEVRSASKSYEDQQLSKCFKQIEACCLKKIQKVKQSLNNNKHSHRGHHHHKDYLNDGYLYSILDHRQRSKLMTFYQEQNGFMIFLHQICDKYLRKLPTPPTTIKQRIVEVQEIEYNLYQMKKYPQISHLTINQEIDLVIVDITNLLDRQLANYFREDLLQFRNLKKEVSLKEQKLSAKLSVEYQKKRKCLQEAKKQEEAQFMDIMPRKINVSELASDKVFPSLIRVQSSPEHEARSHSKSLQYKHLQNISQRDQIKIQESDISAASNKERQPQIQPPKKFKLVKSEPQTKILEPILNNQVYLIEKEMEGHDCSGQAVNKEKNL